MKKYLEEILALFTQFLIFKPADLKYWKNTYKQPDKILLIILIKLSSVFRKKYHLK